MEKSTINHQVITDPFDNYSISTDEQINTKNIYIYKEQCR
jgi:hypothetical protein